MHPFSIFFDTHHRVFCSGMAILRILPIKVLTKAPGNLPVRFSSALVLESGKLFGSGDLCHALSIDNYRENHWTAMLFYPGSGCLRRLQVNDYSCSDIHVRLSLDRLVSFMMVAWIFYEKGRSEK